MSEAEEIVLGSMMASRDATDEVSALLTGRDFYQPSNEVVYDAIIALAAANKPTEPTSIIDHLGTNAPQCGGIARLHALMGSAVGPDSARHYATIVRADATRRTIRAAGAKLATLADVPEGDALELVNAARAELDGLTERDDSDITNAEAVWQAVEALDEPPGLPTPWPSLTKILAGWKPQAMYIFGARTSVGKSVVALACLLDMARRGKTAILFSLEMSKVEVYHRMLSSVGSIDGSRIQQRALRTEDFAKAGKAAEAIAKLPLVVDDRAGLSVAQIRSKVRSVQRHSEVGLVIVDYLGKVKPPADTPRNDRRVQVDAIAWGLKEIARELNVPLIAMSQLNRGVESRADRTPTSADLRESGGQEQDSDVVVLMHRALSEKDGDPTALHLNVSKNRHGPLSAVELIFLGHFSRAEEHSWHTEGATA